MTVRHDCSGKKRGAHRDVSGRVYKCIRPATVKRDGKWYCWQHDPERMEADEKKRRAADNAELDRRSAMWKRRARNTRLAELVTPRLAELLEHLAKEISFQYADCKDLGHSGTAWGTHLHTIHKSACELAARIREALEANDAEDRKGP